MDQFSVLLSMKILHFIVGIGITLGLGSSDAQIAFPDAGKTVDETVKGKLATSVPESCVSIDLGAATIVLDRRTYEESAEAMHVPSLPENKRKYAPWLAREARKFLDAAGHDRDQRNCIAYPYVARSRLPYQFTSALHDGSAVVVANAKNEIVPGIRVRFLATAGNGGHLTYFLPDGMDFYHAAWWVR